MLQKLTSHIHDYQSPRWIGYWLLIVAVMVVLMAWIGAVTRLTESGLSIVDWRPVTGALPPLSEQSWLLEFDKYRTSPQYLQINKGMSLEEFKKIFWWEYIHRLWGRLLGVVFLIPFVWGVLKGYMRGSLALKIGGLFFLGGLQGLIGWWMVKSGLVNEPAVSAYRLMIHLLMAAAIYIYALWLALGILRPVSISNPSYKWRDFFMILYLLLLIASGALMAGTDAALSYPLLVDGQFIPRQMLQESYTQLPLYQDIFSNLSTIQLNHRLLAIGFVFVFAVSMWPSRAVSVNKSQRRAKWSVLLLTALQVILGIKVLVVTGINGQIPVMLASFHQMSAFLILGSAVWYVYEKHKAYNI